MKSLEYPENESRAGRIRKMKAELAESGK